MHSEVDRSDLERLKKPLKWGTVLFRMVRGRSSSTSVLYMFNLLHELENARKIDYASDVETFQHSSPPVASTFTSGTHTLANFRHRPAQYDLVRKPGRTSRSASAQWSPLVQGLASADIHHHHQSTPTLHTRQDESKVSRTDLARACSLFPAFCSLASLQTYSALIVVRTSRSVW